MDAVVQLEQRVAKSDNEYNQSGNVLLNEILGARIIHYPEGEDEAGADNALFEEAKKLKAMERILTLFLLVLISPLWAALAISDAHRR